MASATGYVRGMFHWTVKDGGIIAPDERPPAAQSVALGVQHIFAMFGATFLGPLLMGFDPNVAIFFSGIGTLIFFVCVRGRVPSYLGSSFSFIAVVGAATAYSGSGANANLATALGGIIACGAVYAVIGLIVMVAGYKWVEWLMPPVITGAVVMVIGLNLAHVAVSDMSASPSWFADASNDIFFMTLGLLTTVSVLVVAAWAPGALGRLPILLGGIVGYLLYFVATNILSLGPSGAAISFKDVETAAWVGLPNFTAPQFDARAIGLIAPIAIVLVAENLGHVKAVAAMTGRDLDPYIGRAFLGDGIATMVAGSGGGTGVTTYAENIGVMAVTKIYSSLVFVIAAVVAIAMGLCPKFGALIFTVPACVLGGLAIVLFGLIAATGARIWVQNRVDFSETRNLVTVAAALTIGAGDLTLTSGDFSLSGIAMATFGAIIAYQVLGLVKIQETETPAPEEAGPMTGAAEA
jgi:putative pyrimidine permease RutG